MYRRLSAVLFAFALPVWSKGLSPYLPLKTSPEVEAQIERVMALTPGAPLTRPYKAADVKRRLELIKESHPLLHRQLAAYIERFEQPYGLTHASATASAADDNKRALPNQRNIRNDASYDVSLGGLAYVSPYAYISSGVRHAQDAGTIHYNTHVAFGYEYAQVELGYREHWFSPFQDSAMLVSTHAEASPSITISNSTPISDWNIRYEVFYSILEEVDAIVLGDETFPGRPRHAGLHLSFTPLDFWTLGFNRTLQFGGGEREVTFGDVIEALFDPAGKDNVGDVVTDDINFEFGNQQASITSKWNFYWGMPISLYMEYGGEDTVNESNFSLGNETWSYGAFLPQLTDNVSLRYEYNQWSTRWYTHHLYPDGYTNGGQVMGHWGGGERTFNEDTEAKAHSVNINWRRQNGHLLDATLRLLDNNNTATTTYETGYEVDLTYSVATQYGFVGVTLYAGRDVFGDSFNRLSAFYRW